MRKGWSFIFKKKKKYPLYPQMCCAKFGLVFLEIEDFFQFFQCILTMLLLFPLREECGF